MKILRNILQVYYKVERAILAVILAIVTVVVFVATVGRYSGLYKLPSAEEIARYLIIWMVFLGAGIAGRNNRHFNVPAIIDLLPKRGKQVVYVIHIVLMAIVSIFFLKYGLTIVQTAMKMNQASAMLKMPMWILYVSLLVGTALCWIGYTRNRVEEIIKVQKEIAEDHSTKGGSDA